MATLKISQDQAYGVLEDHINEGADLLVQAQKIHADSRYREWEQNYDHWIKVTVAALEHAYEGAEPARRFHVTATTDSFLLGATWSEDLASNARCLEKAINELSALIHGLKYAAPTHAARTGASRLRAAVSGAFARWCRNPWVIAVAGGALAAVIAGMILGH
jgi:hypothetical protein